jgi:sugar phosphate isomerase/epimerase
MIGSKPEEFTRLFKEVKNKNLGILFDFGHSYGNMHLYKMTPKEYITPLLKKIFAFHIHKGFNRDAHAKVPNLKFFSDFPKGYFKKKFLTCEVNRLDMKGILQQRKLLEGLKA